MGIESFYVNIHMKKHMEYDLSDLSIYSLNSNENQISFTISYAIISFFDGICQIYSFTERYRSEIISIESKRIELMGSLDSFVRFAEKMIELWGEKIFNFQREYGKFLIGPNEEFYKKYKKIKKYMKFR